LEEKKRLAAREAALKIAKSVPEPKKPEPQSDPEPPKIQRKVDEEAIKRLSSCPKKTELVITDRAKFLKRYKLSPDDKIFIIIGGYPAIRKALEERGWFENPDPKSPCYDLI